MLKTAFVPWLLTVLMAGYVWALTSYSARQSVPEPDFDFYDTAVVHVLLPGPGHLVRGEFHNVLVGNRIPIEASEVAPGRFRLSFRVNSPRPAQLYLDDFPLEIFLVPGDTALKVLAAKPDSLGLWRQVNFEGENANLSRYLKQKRDFFDEMQFRARRSTLAANSMEEFSARLDSMAARELSFLAEQQIYARLPDWFVDFEKNEILYQKAYLKLSQAPEQPVAARFVDPIPVSNPDAQFSYYYYLFVQAYIQRLTTTDGPSAKDRIWNQLMTADSLLGPPVHDVYMARTLYDAALKGDSLAAREVFEGMKKEFNSRKYVRYLNYQLPVR